MEKLTIGKVASQAAVGIETIRFYERQGLVPPPPRTESGYRLYPNDTVARLRFIKNAKELGFSLKEIGELLQLQQTSTATKAEVRQRTVSKIREIEQKIASLSAIRDTLIRLVESCPGHGPLDDCPIMEAMETDHCCHGPEDKRSAGHQGNNTKN